MSKILIIDDEEALRANLRDVLTFEDYHVLEASNGTDGIYLAVERQPDLIICDIAMPGIDGYVVLEELHHNPRTTGIPVILLTARAEKAAAELGAKLGAEAYIKKPFSFDEVLETIRAYLGE
ncbi:MAG: response regulator [Anaerolineae bacterium]|nr:response regulator [Anaerolineae bacterium]